MNKFIKPLSSHPGPVNHLLLCWVPLKFKQCRRRLHNSCSLQSQEGSQEWKINMKMQTSNKSKFYSVKNCQIWSMVSKSRLKNSKNAFCSLGCLTKKQDFRLCFRSSSSRNGAGEGRLLYWLFGVIISTFTEVNPRSRSVR